MPISKTRNQLTRWSAWRRSGSSVPQRACVVGHTVLLFLPM